MFTTTAAVLLVGLVCIYVNGNDSEQFQVFQPRTNTQYPLKTNHVRRLCPRNACTEIDREGSTSTQCMMSGCIKRALQEDVGPFWANRGKKDPTYRKEPLYVEEPRWILVRRAQDQITPLQYDFEPFFITRGKKNTEGVEEEQEDKDTIQAIYAKMRIRNHYNSGLRTTE